MLLSYTKLIVEGTPPLGRLKTKQNNVPADMYCGCSAFGTPRTESNKRP